MFNFNKDKMSSLKPNENEVEHQSKETEEGKYQVDPEVVQIKAGKAEIERRIFAFIERKRIEINENNIRDFCSVIDCNQENSCARTDAVFTPYPGHKSHVKVSRVVNSYGPQTRTLGAGQTRQKPRNTVPECGNQAVEERLQNMEAHLKLFSGGPVPKDIYERIKRLENRILELEGLSPEYFYSMNPPNKRQKTDELQDWALPQIDEKMNALKSALLQKAAEMHAMKTERL